MDGTSGSYSIYYPFRASVILEVISGYSGEQSTAVRVSNGRDKGGQHELVCIYKRGKIYVHNHA